MKYLEVSTLFTECNAIDLLCLISFSFLSAFRVCIGSLREQIEYLQILVQTLSRKANNSSGNTREVYQTTASQKVVL